MLEEDKAAMDKKAFSRQSSVPPPLKSNNGSSDKKNDNCNKFARNNRKRESVGNGRGGSDNATRRPAPQKWGSGSDKRPRSRTFNPFDRQREEVAGSFVDEEDSNYRSKKGNLNHLLNFSFAPREVDAFVGGSIRRTKTSSRVRFDKKRFLQANCQFIVKDTGDYCLHSADPDFLVDWDLVELVRLYSLEKPLCPICLDSPVAAKVTRCGHIYCWSCILHLFSLEDGAWAECPICYSPILDKDLKSAEAIVVKPYKVGDVITMKLMKREPESTYSVPKDQWTNRNGEPHRIHDDDKVTRYMKLLVATPSEILSRVIEREKISLETQMLDSEVSEVCFIETAQVQLKERESELQLICEVEKSLSRCDKKCKPVLYKDTQTLDQQNTNISTNEISTRIKTVSISSTTSQQSDEYPVITAGRFKTFSESSISDTDCTNDVKVDGLNLPKSQSVPVELYEGTASSLPSQSQGTYADEYQDSMILAETGNGLKNHVQKPKNKHVYASKNGYYCFQAEDGQQIYIHNINSRCLTHEFGSLETSPKHISARIIDIRSMNMTEDVRARTKYLDHLPLSSIFLIVELDLKPPVLSRKTLDLFHSEIELKKRSRQKKERTERQREKKIYLEENMKLGKYPELKISLESEYQFPSSLNGTDQPSLYIRSSDYPQASEILSSPSTTPDDITPQPSPEQSLSFAQMLRNGPTKNPAPVWPKLSPKPKEESYPSLGARSVYIDSDGSEIEDYAPVPEYGQSFGNAIQAALDNAAVVSKSASKSSKPKGGKNSKKKNRKTKVLFSTSMTRGNTD